MECSCISWETAGFLKVWPFVTGGRPTREANFTYFTVVLCCSSKFLKHLEFPHPVVHSASNY